MGSSSVIACFQSPPTYPEPRRLLASRENRRKRGYRARHWVVQSRGRAVFDGRDEGWPAASRLHAPHKGVAARLTAPAQRADRADPLARVVEQGAAARRGPSRRPPRAVAAAPRARVTARRARAERSAALRAGASRTPAPARAAGGTSQSGTGVVAALKSAAGKAGGPALAIGAGAAGVAGGLALKSIARPKKILGVPIPRSIRKAGLTDVDVKSVAKAVGKASKRFGETSKNVSRDIERVGDQAERDRKDPRLGAVARQSKESGHGRNEDEIHALDQRKGTLGGTGQGAGGRGSVATAARRAKGPAVTVGAAAAGLAGGLALGSRVNPARRGLGALLTPQPKDSRSDLETQERRGENGRGAGAGGARAELGKKAGLGDHR